MFSHIFSGESDEAYTMLDDEIIGKVSLVVSAANYAEKSGSKEELWSRCWEPSNSWRRLYLQSVSADCIWPLRFFLLLRGFWREKKLRGKGQ